jgi:hypothetical protein
MTLVWFVIGGAAIGHYFLHADRPYGWEAWIASSIYGALGIIPLAMYFAHLRVARRVRDPRLWVNAQGFWIGKTFNVKVEQSFRKPAHVQSVRACLICEKIERGSMRSGKSMPVANRQFEICEDVRVDREVSPSQPLQVKTKLTVPTSQPASTLPDKDDLPRIAWRIAVAVQIANQPAYAADYPILVEA